MTQLRVLRAGPATTVQDAGRLAWLHVGVSPAGFAVPLLAALGNTLSNDFTGVKEEIGQAVSGLGTEIGVITGDVETLGADVANEAALAAEDALGFRVALTFDEPKLVLEHEPAAERTRHFVRVPV